MHVASTTPPELGEDEALRRAPLVRAELVSRYENLYALCQQQVHRSEEVGRPVDPRWVELSVRINKELAGIFRLHKPAPVEQEEVPLPVYLDEVVRSLELLEKRASADVPA